MKITKITDRHRRDIRFTAQCEHCNHVEKDSPGYDDDHFHRNVMPNRKCPECGETSLSKDSGTPLTAVIPKYRQDEVV